MSVPLRILILEDQKQDAELMLHELRRSDFDPIHCKVVDNEADYLANLSPSIDVILSDYLMPGFGAPEALYLLREHGLDIPFIVVSGAIGEEIAVSMMREGAIDYVMKDRMARLGPAIGRALESRNLRIQQRQTAETLHQSEERYRLLFEGAPVPMWIYEHDSLRYVAVNEAALRHYGYSRKEFLSSTIKLLHLEGDVPKLLELMGESPSGNLGIWKHRKKDGSIIDVEIISNFITIGRHKLRCGMAYDVTERRRNEERILEQASLLDLANDAIIVCDIDHHILFWNQRAESLYGWNSAEAVGRKTTDLIHAGDPGYNPATRHLLSHGSWSGELTQITKDGKKLVVDTRWTLLKDEKGVPKSVLAINTDITEKKKLEEQFLRSQRLESIGTLASGLAHDLNNILSPIYMSSAMLRENLSPEMREGIVRTIEESAQRGSEIVRQVLTFARGAQGKGISIQPRHLIREIQSITQETFPKSVTIINCVPSDLRTVTGDPTQLHQVLLNLCINARDAMPDGGKLVLAAKNMDIDEPLALMFNKVKPGPYVVVEVQDTGIGIPPEIIDKIFDPFFTTKEQGKGTGLGLSTVIGIVKSHDGFLHVESEPGKGATFRIFLPANSEGKDDHESQPQDAVAPAGNGETILVVDDENEIRKVIETLLNRNGYRAITASEGNEALKKFVNEAGAVRLVLTDVMMPLVDGVVLTRALKKMDPKINVIASSGNQEHSRHDELRSLGVKTFLKKPYNAGELLRTVNAVLHG